MTPTSKLMPLALIIWTASCSSPRPEPIAVLPDLPRCPAPILPKVLTDPVEIPSFLRDPMR